MSETIDALFVSNYVDIDRWHNDEAGDLQVPSVGRVKGTLSALSDTEWMKDEVDVVMEGRLYDFSRFLSWVRHGKTTEWQRYDVFSMTLMAIPMYLLYEIGLVMARVLIPHKVA